MAVSLCPQGTVEQCGKALYPVLTDIVQQQLKSKADPVLVKKNLKIMVSENDFIPIYQKCQDEGKNQDDTIACLIASYTKGLTTVPADGKAKTMVQETLPKIVKNWNKEEMISYGVPGFDAFAGMLAGGGKLLYGTCQVGNIEEGNRQISTDTGDIMIKYHATLTCEKNNGFADLIVVLRDGKYQYLNININNKK